MKQTQPPDPLLRRALNPRSLWDDAGRAPTSLGCWTCVDKEICGGAHSDASFFDCNDYCQCPDKDTCDLVCRGNPATYVARYREVGTFDLMKAPRAPKVAVGTLPSMVPLIEHNSARHERLNFPIVALPLHKLVDLDKGIVRYRGREALAAQFGIDPHARLVVSGVARDRRIERYWALPNRPAILAELAALDISLLTPPNFSVLTGVPRSDNLHAMKRIFLAWVEMAQAGIPTALHINGRTERDYERWAELIDARPEITCLAVEFATGAGRGGRIDWHVARLNELAAHVSRPLRLVLRGGGRVLEPLRQSYAAVTMIDTDAFTKTRCRQQAYFTESGKLTWRNHPTDEGEPIDALLQHNVAMLHSHHTYLERLHADHRLTQSVRCASAVKNRDRKAV